MRSLDKTVIICTTADGVLICPDCGKVIRGVRVDDLSTATGLHVFCRYCKAEYEVNIEKGQRLQGQRQ